LAKARGSTRGGGFAERSDDGGKRGALVEGGDGARADFVGGTRSGDRDEQVLAAIEVDQWGGGLVVGGEAHLDGFGTVVFALKERGATVVANVFALRRLVDDVEDGFATNASAASAEARDDFRNREFVVDDGVEREIFGAEELTERFSLDKRAGKAVEEEAAGTAEAAGPFANHFPDGRVWDEFAAAHVIERGGHGG